MTKNPGAKDVEMEQMVKREKEREQEGTGIYHSKWP